jgi:hypothetical protein
VVIEHVVCDNPVCVQAHPDPQVGHIWPSTQSENLHRMQAKGRGQRGQRLVAAPLVRAGPRRTRRRSRQLAAAVRDGWDDAAVRAVLLRIDPCPNHRVLTVYTRLPRRSRRVSRRRVMPSPGSGPVTDVVTGTSM